MVARRLIESISDLDNDDFSAEDLLIHSIRPEPVVEVWCTTKKQNPYGDSADKETHKDYTRTTEFERSNQGSVSLVQAVTRFLNRSGIHSASHAEWRPGVHYIGYTYRNEDGSYSRFDFYLNNFTEDEQKQVYAEMKRLLHDFI